jgi:hypothetical protein
MILKQVSNFYIFRSSVDAAPAPVIIGSKNKPGTYIEAPIWFFATVGA